MQRAFQIIREHPSVRHVILSARSSPHVAGPIYGNLGVLGVYKVSSDRQPGATAAQIYLEGLSRSMAEMKARGIHVTFVVQVPETGFDPKTCIRVRPTDLLKAVRQPCAASRTDVDPRQAPFREVLAVLKARHPEVSYLDPRDVRCDDRSCRALNGARPIYRDTDHMTVTGSQEVWRALTASGDPLARIDTATVDVSAPSR